MRDIETLDAGAALAWELRLFEEVAERPEKRFLKFWQSPQALVAPKKLAIRPGFDQAARTLAADGWPLHVRATGGDATPQGPGIVNVTHVYTHASGGAFDIAAAYDRLCTPIETALGPGATRGWQPGTFCDGHTVLAHALMLFEPPAPEAIAAINRFLSFLGEDRTIRRDAHTGLPDGQSAESFVTRLRSAFRETEAAH